MSPHLFHPLIFSLDTWCHQVSIKRDVNIHIVTINCIFSLPFVKPNPDLVVQSQIQHDTLALHDRPFTRLSVQDHLFLVIVHQMKIGLLKVPCVDVNVKEVDPWDITVEFSLEHVEVLVDIDKHSVEHQGLVVVHTVQGLATSH